MADVEEGPPEPVFRLPKNASPPFDMVALVDVDRVYSNPADISLEVNGELVRRLRYAKFTMDGVQNADVGKVCHMLRVFQMLFDAGESDIDWYTNRLNDMQEEVSELRQSDIERQRLEALCSDLEVRLKDRGERITELEIEAAAKKDAEREADVTRQKLYQIQSELERQRLEAEEYRKASEKKLQKAADFESKTRRDNRDSERDTRALQLVIQQHEEDLEQLRRSLRSHQNSESVLRQQLHEAEVKEKRLDVVLSEIRAENEELKIRLEEKDDQCLSLEKRAVEDLHAFKGHSELMAAEKDSLIIQLRKEIQHMAESLAVGKEESHTMHTTVLELQQQVDEMAEKVALKEKECRQLRLMLDRERNRPAVQDSQHLGFLKTGASPTAAYDRDEVIQLTDALKQTKRELLVEQAKVKDGETERGRLDRDIAELRKQLDVYESSGPGAAVRDIRQNVANMQLKLEEREEAIAEMRDRLNQAEEDLDTVLQFTESLKQLALSLGVSRSEITQLANNADNIQRRRLEADELEEKIRVRDKEIELLERERLHWKKQVRLQALPKLEQARRMGLTTEQLDVLSEITDRMRESGLSDVQALVGMGPDDGNVLYNQTRHAELEHKLQTAQERNDMLQEMHRRLRALYIDVCKERDQRRLLANAANPAESYMQGLLLQALSSSSLSDQQQQELITQLGGQPPAAEQPEPQDDKPDPTTEGSENKPSKKKSSSKASGEKTPKQGQSGLKPPQSPFAQNLLERLASLGPQPLFNQGDDRVAKLISEQKENASLLVELRKELQRTNDSLEAAEKRSKSYMEERDAFRRTLAIYSQHRSPRTRKPSEQDAQSPKSGHEEEEEQRTPKDLPSVAAEVWDTQGDAFPSEIADAESIVELRRLLAGKEHQVSELLKQNEKKEEEMQEARKLLEDTNKHIEALEREGQMKADELMQQKASINMLRESLTDTEQLLREERARLEEHQEFIGGLAGERDGDTLRQAITETMHKVTTLRVNEIRLIHQYKMCKAETDASRERLMSFELQYETLHKSLTEELAVAKAQLKESEGVQKVLHDRLEFIEKTRTHEALREQLAATQEQLQALYSIDRGILHERSTTSKIKAELEHQKVKADESRMECEALREQIERLQDASQTAPLNDPQRQVATLQSRIVELDVEIKSCRQKMEASRKRAENSLSEANVLEDEKNDLQREVLSVKKDKVDLLDRIKALEASKEATVPLQEVKQLQQKCDVLEREKVSLEARYAQQQDIAQNAVEHQLTVTQIQQSYAEEASVLRRVIEGLQGTEQGYLLGELQYRSLQNAVQNIHLRREKDRVDLLLVSKRQQAEAMQVQNTQLLSDLSRIYKDYITKSHELLQENNLLKSESRGRLSPEESQKLNHRLEKLDEQVQAKEMLLRQSELKVQQLGSIKKDAEHLRHILNMLNEKDMSKIEIELKRQTGELSSVKLATLQTEWEADQLKEEVKMLRRLKHTAEEKIQALHTRTVELQQQRDSDNSEFEKKIEEVYEELKRSKAREVVLGRHESPRRETSGKAPKQAHDDKFSEEQSAVIKELRQAEALSNRTISELRAANTDLKATIADMQAEKEKQEHVVETLQKEVLNERLKARQAVERIRQAETSRGEALSEVAKNNIRTMQDLLKKKDDALTRLTDQLNSERQKAAAERQIDHARIAKLHQQLHDENSEQLKKFSEKLESLTLAPAILGDEFPEKNSLPDIKLAQATAEISRLQSKLSLADAEVKRLQRDKQESLQRFEDEVKRLTTQAAQFPTHAPAPASQEQELNVTLPETDTKLPHRLQEELDRLGDELRKERQRAKEAESEVLEERRLRLEQEEFAKKKEAAAEEARRLAEASRKEVEVSTDGLEAQAAIDEAFGSAMDKRPLQPGDRVMTRRQLFFKSGRQLDIGDFGVVHKAVGDLVEVVFDKFHLVYDCRPGVDIELAPNPAFTVYPDTPIQTVNSIILQRETLIRKQSLQIDSLERELLTKSKELSRLAEAEALAIRKQKELQGVVRELETFVQSGAPQPQGTAATALKAAEQDKETISKLEKDLRGIQKEKKILEAENSDLRGSVQSLKQEVASEAVRLQQLERKKADEDLAERFDRIQSANSENVKSLQERLRAMESDLNTVRDRELLLRKETQELEFELSAEKSAKELAQQAVRDAMERRTRGTSTSPRAVVQGEAQTSAKLLASSSSATDGPPPPSAGVTVELAYWKSRARDFEGQVQGLEVRYKLLQEMQGSEHRDTASRKVDDLLREKAEWTAMKSALLQHLRTAQNETAGRERAITRQLAACKAATEVRVRQAQHEADAAIKQRGVRIAVLEKRLAELEENNAADKDLETQLSEATAAAESLKTELTKSEVTCKDLRKKVEELQQEEKARKERIIQNRADRAAAKKSNQKTVATNTEIGDSYSESERRRSVSPKVRSSRGGHAGGIMGEKTSQTASTKPEHTAELMKYWGENKKLKKQIASLKAKEKKSGATIAMTEYEKLKSEAIRLSEELQFTKERLKEKGEELHQRAVDLHTFEKVKSFKQEIMKLEEQNDRLKRTLEVDKEMEVRNLQAELRRKSDILAQYEALASSPQSLPPSEVIASEPYRVINTLVQDLGGPSAQHADKLEALRRMFNSLEENLLEARNQVLQLRYTKEAAALSQQRAERHLKDLMSISPSSFSSVDDIFSARIGQGAIYTPPTAAALASPRPNRDRQLHDMSQVIEGLRQVIQKLQSDNDSLKKNAVSNQKHVEVLKENKYMKHTIDELKKQLDSVVQQQQQKEATTTESTVVTQLKKRIKREQELSETLKEEADSLREKLAIAESTAALGEREFSQRVAEKLREAADKAQQDEDEITKLRTESSVLSEEVQRYKKENDHLRERVDKLEQDLSLFDSDFLEEVAELQRQNDALRLDNQRLEERLQAHSALGSGTVPMVGGVQGLRQRAASLRASVDSTDSFSSADDQSGLSRRVAAILRGAGSSHNNPVMSSTSTSSSSVISRATLDLSRPRPRSRG